VLLAPATLRVGATPALRAYRGSTLVWAPPATVAATAPVGNLPGWTQVYAEDFTTPATSTQVETTYPHLAVYPDGSGDGKYQAENVTVSGGMLQIALHNVGGQGQGGALVVKPGTSDNWGQTYGRYSARVRADYLPGFGAAIQLWPSDDVWEHGETDYPEGDFSGTVYGYNHQVGANPEVNNTVINTGKPWQAWHTYTVEWTPLEMRFYLDDILVDRDGDAVASTARNWVFQAAESGTGTASTTSGFLQVDWVAVWSYDAASTHYPAGIPATY
jgi:beta-glucanase (GH16 family)